MRDRFCPKVDRSPGQGPAGDCWEWTAARDPYGYGRFWCGRRMVLAHRVAFVLAGGLLTEDEPQVLHRCDNPPCCNAAHLFSGTPAANVADMVAKARAYDSAGERNGRAKLTAQEVQEIRERCAVGESQRAVAREFAIGHGTVSGIVSRRRWR